MYKKVEYNWSKCIELKGAVLKNNKKNGEKYCIFFGHKLSKLPLYAKNTTNCLTYWNIIMCHYKLYVIFQLKEEKEYSTKFNPGFPILRYKIVVLPVQQHDHINQVPSV